MRDRKTCLFVGSAQSGERAANIMSLIDSATLCGHDPWECIRDVLGRQPTTLNRDLHTLLPQHWRAPERAKPTPVTEAGDFA